MQVGGVTLPVSLDISQLPVQARKVSTYLKDINLPGVGNVGKQIESLIGTYESVSKVARDFGVMQARLSAGTARDIGNQANSFLSFQNILGKFGTYAGNVFKGLNGSVKAFHLPALAGVAGLGIAFSGLAPLISGIAFPLLGLGGSLGTVAQGFLNANLMALNFGARGLTKQIKLIKELLPATSLLKKSLGNLLLPQDLFASFGRFRMALTNAQNQVTAFKAKVDALAMNLVTNAGGLLAGGGVFAAGAGAVAPAAAPVNPVMAAFDANKGVAEYVKFEQSMAMFQALASSSGASAKDIASVTEEAKRLGAATTKSAVDAAGLAGDLTRLGFTAKQVSESMAGVVATSEATAEPLAAVGPIIASTINQFKLSADDAGMVGDVLGTMANVTATSIIDMGEAMKYVGGTAKLANQSLEDTAISIGVLANAGLNGGMAGTALNAALVSLQKAAGSAKSEIDILNNSMSLTSEEMALLSTLTPTGEGAEFSAPAAGGADLKGKALAQLGISKEDLLDSTGSLKSMLDIIPAIREGVAELNKTAEGTAKVPILLDSLFGEQGGRAIKALISTTQESLNDLKTSATEASGFSAAVSEDILGGISGTLSKLLSASQGISLVVGEFFAPMIQYIADEITELMNSFLGLPPVLQKVLLAGTMLMPFMTLYWRSLVMQKYAIPAYIAVKKLLVAVQTEEGRSNLKNSIILSVQEAKTRAITTAQAAQAVGTQVLTGQTSLLAAAQMGLAKVMFIIKASYAEWFSTLAFQINAVKDNIKWIGQLGLKLTTLTFAQKAAEEGQRSLTAAQIIGNTISDISSAVKGKYLDILEGSKVAIYKLTHAYNAETGVTVKLTAAQIIQGGVTKALATAKNILALVTGRVSTANLGLIATYGVLIARLAIIAGAVYALKSVWEALTAGMAEASKLKKAADNIDNITASSKIFGKESKDNEGIIGRFFNSLSDGEGPVMAIQKALGLATNANVAFRREMEATELVAKSTNALFDEGMAILNKYGVAQIEQGDKARLGAEGIKAFVDEATDQVRKIDETISELQKQTPVNEEAKQAIQTQIALLTRQSSLLQSRIQLIQSDTDISKENAEAQAAVVISLESLQKKYQQLEKAQGFSDKTEALKIEEALAEGSLTAAKAAEAREQAESQAIQSRIDLNNKALEELKSSAEFVPADDRAKLEEEIANRTIAAVDLRIEAAKKEVEEREKLNEKLMESERAKISTLESQMGIDKSKQIQSVKAEQASGGLSQGEAKGRIEQIETESIQNAITLEQKRLEVERGLAQKGLITRQEFAEKQREVEQKTADLSVDLLDKQIDAHQQANDEILKGLEDRLAQQEAALGLSNNTQIAAVRQAQLDGSLTEEDAELKLQGIRQNSVEKEKAIAQDRLAQTQQLVAQGVITQEEATKEIAAAEKELSDLNIQTLEEELSARETAKEKRLQDVADLVARESASAGLASQLEINAVKQAQAEKLITAEQAEKQLSDIKAQGLAEEVDRQSQQLAQIAQLRDEGILTEQEYGDKRIELEHSIADVSSQIIESQIQEQQRLSQERVALLEAELKRSESLQDIANNNRTASLKQALNSGAISEAEFSKQTAQLKVQEAQQAIASEQRKLSQVSQLLAEGLITAKEAAERRLDIEKSISEKEISLIDSKEAARKSAADAAIKSMEEVASRQAALAEVGNLKDELKIKQSGGSEDEIAAQLAESSKKATEAAISAAKQQMAEVSRLQARGLLSSKEAADRRLALEKEVLQGTISLVDQRIESEKKATEAILKESEKQADARKFALEMDKLKGELAILQGGGTDDEIAAKLDALNEKSAKDSIAITKSQMAEVARLHSLGVISAEEAAKQRLELEKEVISGQIGLLQQRRAAEQKLTDQILKESEKRTQAQQDDLDRTTTAGITAIKARELAGSLSAEKAADEIAQIEMDAQRQQLVNLQSQLAEVAALRQQGLLTVEQASDKERELNKQVADSNLSLIEKQIDAKKRAADEAIAAIDKTLTAAKRSLELGSARSDITSNRLGQYGEKVDATAGLMSATNNLENQRLEFQIKMAESKGKEVLAEQLRAEQFRAQFEQLQQTQEVQANQLALSQRQKEIEMEREQIQARIALLEAQAEFAKAKASGASAEELAYLKEMISLRDEALNWTQEAIAGQEEINRLEEESLRVSQQAEKEAAAQARVLDLQGKLLDDQAGARGVINKELKDAQKLQQGLEGGFKKPLDSTYTGFEGLSDKLKGASVGSINRPIVEPKPPTNVSGDIIGANTITINVSGEGSAPTDIKQAVLSAMGDVTNQLKTKLGG